MQANARKTLNNRIQTVRTVRYAHWDGLKPVIPALAGIQNLCSAWAPASAEVTAHGLSELP